MFYASTKKVVPQVLSDIGLLVWTALWIFLAVKVRDLVRLIGVPAEKARDGAQSMSRSLYDAASSVHGVPVLGDVLTPSLNSFGTGLTAMALTAQQFVSFVNTTAIVLATLVFAIAFGIYLWKWVPWRFEFVREATAGRKLLPADAAERLFALRAMANAPMHDLVKITRDPMGAWQRGDVEVIRKLADLELARDGLRLPRQKSILTRTDTSRTAVDGLVVVDELSEDLTEGLSEVAPPRTDFRGMV